MEQIVGTGVARLDAPAKATGRARYAADYSAPGMLHVVLVRADTPHARLLGVDTSALPEGVCCFTAKDIPSNLLPSIKNDQPVLAQDHIRFRGEPVAIVAAPTLAEARKAAAAVHVETEALPVIESVGDALAPGAAQLFPGGNLCGEFHSTKGEPGAAFCASVLVLEDTFHLPVQDHGYLEPPAAFTELDEKGRLWLVASTQNAFADRDMIASVLKLPTERVTARAASVGGGFGGKDGNTAQIFAAVVTHFTGRPAKLVFTREETIRYAYKRHSAEVRVKMGFSAEGKILAFNGEMKMDTGAYAILGPAVLGLGVEHLPGPYDIPNVQLDGWLCYTNHTPASAMRGFGAPQGAMATETLLNRAATLLGLDPVGIRLQNAVYTGGEGTLGQRMEHSVGFADALRQFAESPFYREMVSNPQPDTGYGIAAGMMSSGMGKNVPDHATAVIEKQPCGRYLVRIGLVDIGQGSETALAMIAAQALGVGLDKIEMRMADTEDTVDSGSTAASRSTYICGNAILEAAALICEGQTRAEACSDFPEPEEANAVHAIFGFIVQGIKLHVDPVTGAVRLLDVHNVTEAGRIIHPDMMAGQIFGGIAMSAGYALSEEVRCRNGKTLEDSFASYVMPTAMDAPRMTNENVPYREESGPYGAKGVAEASTVALAPAIAAAVEQLAPGAHLNRLPLDRTEILAHLLPRS